MYLNKISLLKLKKYNQKIYNPYYLLEMYLNKINLLSLKYYIHKIIFS